MKLTYPLEHNDFSQHQLFIASKNARINKQRTRTWLIVSFSFLLVGFMFYQIDNNFLFYYFLAIGIASFIFYPGYQRRHYKNHYSKFITENYKNRFGQTGNIEFTESSIETHDATGQSTLYLTEIENMTETGAYFYLKLKAGGDIINLKLKT